MYFSVWMIWNLALIPIRITKLETTKFQCENRNVEENFVGLVKWMDFIGPKSELKLALNLLYGVLRRKLVLHSRIQHIKSHSGYIIELFLAVWLGFTVLHYFNDNRAHILKTHFEVSAQWMISEYIFCCLLASACSPKKLLIFWNEILYGFLTFNSKKTTPRNKP